MKNFKRLLSNGRSSLYGYSYSKLPKEIEGLNIERSEIFFKRKNQKINFSKDISWDYYSGYQDTPWSAKDIIFFDQDSVKSLCIGFPSKSKYIVISLKYPKYYFFIILGLLRRFRLKSISIKGIIKLNNGSRFNRWLLIKTKELPTNSLTISSEMGVSGLLSFLNKENINYIVPRFYHNLPDLSQGDGDLDLIVDGENKNTVIDFLTRNPGEIPIDIYTDNGTDYHGMSYLPPKMAKIALSRKIPGPGGSYIPCKEDELNTIIYHALYHKGYISRIRSTNNTNQKDEPSNKYMNVINRLSKELDVNVGSTLEELDYYMASVGWKPAIDTLAKIAQWNEWVRDYHMNKKNEFIPLYVLILKEGLRGSEKEKLVKDKCLEEGLRLIDEEEFSPEIKSTAITELRGGIWNDSLHNPDDVVNFYPYKILVLWDTHERQIEGIAKVKDKIRQIIDTQKTSLVHSTDNYVESLDYIKICMPDKFSFYQDKEAVLKNFSQYTLEKKNIEQRIQDLVAITKQKFRRLILNFLSH
jgi:hypothetical protein